MNKKTKPVESQPSDVQQAITYDYGKKKMSVKKKVFLGIFSLVVVSGLSVGGYFVWENLKPEVVQNGYEDVAYIGMVENYIQGSAMTKANKREELGEGLEGIVTQVFVKPGDTVMAGDLLLTVNPEAITEKLNDELDNLDDAITDLNTSQNALNSLTVTAPFTGKVISSLEENVGSQVYSESVFATIVDDTTMTLTTYFSYGYIDTIKTGQLATVSIPATTSNLQGTVSTVENIKKISPDDGSILFKVTIELPNPGTLTKDMIATACVSTDIGEVYPAESGTLDYIRSQDIILKASGELIYKNVNDYYLYNQGDILGRLENETLVNDVTSKQRTVNSLQETIDGLYEILANTDLVSPIDGQITQVSVAVDDELTESSSIIPVTVANLETLVMDIKISEIDITKAQIGMPVDITYESTDGYFYIYGEITNLSLEAEQTDSYQGPITYFPAQITITDPLNLRPDMNVQYKITAVQKFDILVVPTAALVYTDYGTSLYVKSGSVDLETFPVIDETIPSGYAVLPVEMGISDGYGTEILTPIPDGTPIYVPFSSVISSNSNNGGYDMGYTEEVYYG